MDNSAKDSAYQRSEEEIAWDAEFADMNDRSDTNVASVLGDLAKLVVQVPMALIQMPMAMLPEDTARHARAALREGFLAVRSLVGAVADGVESLLAEPSAGKPPVKGPQGTWGSARQTTSGVGAPPPGKVRRIEVSDEVPESSGSDARSEQGDMNLPEDRGMRADIDY